MLSKKTDLSLLNLLVSYNFIFLRLKTDKKKYNSIVKKEMIFLSPLCKNDIQILDLNQLLKSIKQLIRTLVFLKQSKQSCLTLSVSSNALLSTFLKFFFDKTNNDSSKIIKIEEGYIKKAPRQFRNVFLKLSHIENKKDYESLFRSKYLIIHEINSIINYNNVGTYKIFNSLDDWGKIIFFLILIKRVYLK